MYTYMHTHQIVAAVGGVFIQTNFERKVKGASALYCVYILKNKVLYVFITLIIVIKGLPFLICGFGGFLFVFLFWGFVFCVFFLGKKQTNLLLVFVLLLVRTLNIEVFLKIKDEEK